MLKITLTFTAYGSCCLKGVAQGIFSKHDATGYGSKMLYRTCWVILTLNTVIKVVYSICDTFLALETLLSENNLSKNFVSSVYPGLSVPG